MVAEETAVAEATLEEQEMAATKIQALFRGIHDRAKVEAMKQEEVYNYCIETKMIRVLYFICICNNKIGLSVKAHVQVYIVTQYNLVSDA